MKIIYKRLIFIYIMININPDSDDSNYRYKMPSIETRLAGRGNGSYTFLDNIDKISIAINTPTDILLNYISRTVGSSYNLEKKTITGHYTNEEIQRYIFNFIRTFILCIKCNIPEVIPSVIGKKKKTQLQFKCSACGNLYQLCVNGKNNLKTIDYMIKNIDEYRIKEGNIVMNEDKKNNNELFNPF